MERYGNTDLIRDILERQGLIWLLESLAQDEGQEQGPQKVTDAGLMHNVSRNDRGQYESDYSQNIITENDADKVYLIDAGPGTTNGTFRCDDEVSYPLPFSQLRELAHRQRVAQQQTLKDPRFKVEQGPHDSFTRGHQKAYQTLSPGPSRVQQVNGWTCVTTRPAPNLSPIPELVSKSYSAPIIGYKSASHQTDGPCSDESKYRPASEDGDLQNVKFIKTDSELDFSEAVTRTLIEAAVSKLVGGLRDKERGQKYYEHNYKEHGQVRYSTRLQADKQQEISPNPEATYRSQTYFPSSVSSAEPVDTLSDDPSLVSSYRSAIGRIISKSTRKKPEFYKTLHQTSNATPLALTQHSSPLSSPPSPERCIVEARLVIHLGSGKRAKASKARREAKVKRRNKSGKSGPKIDDSGIIGNDYVRVKYELVELPCYGGADT